MDRAKKERGRDGRNGRARERAAEEKYEAGVEGEETLSAFLLAAKLRIDVSRSIQRLALRRDAPCRAAPARLIYTVKTVHRRARKLEPRRMRRNIAGERAQTRGSEISRTLLVRIVAINIV